MSKLAGDGKLRDIIERIEVLNDEIKALTEDRKEVFEEAKAAGFSVPTLRAVIKIRAAITNSGRQAVEENIAMVNIYMEQLGMGPLFAVKAPSIDAEVEPSVEITSAVIH